MIDRQKAASQTAIPPQCPETCGGSDAAGERAPYPGAAGPVVVQDNPVEVPARRRDVSGVRWFASAWLVARLVTYGVVGQSCLGSSGVQNAIDAICDSQ